MQSRDLQNPAEGPINGNIPAAPREVTLAGAALFLQPIEALDVAGVAALLTVSARKVHLMHAAGELPAPVMLGDRCPRWLRRELIMWLECGAPPRVRWMAMRESALRRLAA